MFEWYDERKCRVLPTSMEFSGTVAIALSFAVLACFLRPAFGKVYHWVRDYCEWCAIETGQTLEVTTYPLVSEIFGVRGRWGAARIVAIVLAAFSLISWGLEHRMDLPSIDDDVTDLFLRPPPVWKNETGDASYVIRPNELDIVESKVANMNKITSIGTANARYEVKGEVGIIDGRVRIAPWDTGENAKNDLFYDYNGEDIANVFNEYNPSYDEDREDRLVTVKTSAIGRDGEPRLSRYMKRTTQAYTDPNIKTLDARSAGAAVSLGEHCYV